MAQALYRKWRPRLWEQVVGQEHIVLTLKNAIQGGRVGHAYLFAGPRGTGKTTTARLLAKAVNCLAPEVKERPCDRCAHCQAVNEGRFLDLIEIDAASNTSVEDVRDLREKINFSPTLGQFKVYIIDEVHMLSTAAFNALLKTLEEPPPHAIFILATTEVHKIPATVLSRCQRHEFRRIPVTDIVNHLQALAAEENIPAEPDALALIARQSTGSLRDAISLLDQLSAGGERVTLAFTQSVLGTAASQAVVNLVEALIARQAAAGLESIHRALDGGSDPRQFARQTVDYLRGLLLIRLADASQVEATPEQRTQMRSLAKSVPPERLLNLIRLFNAAATEPRGSWQPALALEMAFTEGIEEVEGLPHPSGTARPAAAPDSHPTSHPASQPAVRSTPAPAATPAAAGQEVQAVRPAGKNTPPATGEPAAEAEAPAAPAGEGEPTLAAIQQNWKRIREFVRKTNVRTEALLNSCKPLQVKDGCLVLGFNSDILKQRMESSENCSLTRQAIVHLLGKDLPLVCVVMTAKASLGTPGVDMEGGGMVGTALNLGAEIVHKE